MARYRLMLMEGVVANGRRELDDLVRSPPAGIDAAVLAQALRTKVEQPTLLTSGDDHEALERAIERLQRAGLAVCLFDDSTAWIRLAETLRTALGFTRVRVIGHAPPATPTTKDEGPRLGDSRRPAWVRAAILLGAFALPMVATALASGVFDEAIYGAAPGASSTPSPAGADPRAARLSGRAGSGSGGASAPAGGGRGAGSGGASAAGGAGGGAAEVSLEEGPGDASPPATTPPRRTARKATAAVVALLLGLGCAAMLGEWVERSTRQRASLRHRVRQGATVATGVGVVAAAVVGLYAWSASASEPLPVAPRPAPPRPRPPTSPTAQEGCPGGPFARFVCRSHRGAPGANARPFAALLTQFRRRPRPAADAGVDAGTEPAPPRPAHRAHHATRHHHRRHPDRAEAAALDASVPADDVASVAPAAPPAAAPPVPPAEAPAPTETARVAAPEAPAPPTEEPTPPIERDPPAPPPSPQRPLPRGWFAGWLLAGLLAGTWTTPGWRRLRRS